MAAEELNMEKLEDLKRQVESLGFDEKQRNKLITEELHRMREVEAEERNIAAEEQRLASQAEERRIAAEERKASLIEVEKLRLELEARMLSQSQNGEQFTQGSVENVVRTPPLPSFVDRKDNLDEYLLRFERYASVAKWNKSTWATQLSPLLTGKVVEVYNRLSPEEAMNYERLKVALLERYDFTEQGYREKF